MSKFMNDGDLFMPKENPFWKEKDDELKTLKHQGMLLQRDEGSIKFLFSHNPSQTIRFIKGEWIDTSEPLGAVVSPDKPTNVIGDLD